MLRRSAWLAGALAACFLILSPGGASADDEHDEDGARHHKHKGHVEWHRGPGHYEHGHYGYGHGRRHHGRRHHGHRHHGHGHFRHGHGHRHAFRATWLHLAAPGVVVRPRSVAEVLEDAPDGQAIVWNEPQNQTRVEIVPTTTYRDSDGRYCREYLGTATVGGQTREVYGRACRQPDGAWQIVR